MKKQITILALACMGIFLPAASGLTSAAAQETKIITQPNANELRITHISSTDEASKFAVKVTDQQLKNPTLKIYSPTGDEIYSAAMNSDYMVFKVLTEEPAGTLTFALFDGKKKITSRTWQISSVSETRIIATESK